MGAGEDLHLALHAVRLAGLVEGHHTTAAAVAAAASRGPGRRNGASPSLSEAS